jgi:signal transduction histidine kinase
VRFRTRLILAAAYLLVVVVVSLEIPLGLNIAKRARREIELALVRDAAVVAARINDDLPESGTDPTVPPDPPPIIGQVAREVAQATGSRVVIIDALGRVVADSSGEAQIGEVYRTPDRPEFAAVFSVPGGEIDVQTRHSDTLGEDLLFVTAPVVHFRDVIGAVRMSESLGEVDGKVRRSLFGLAAVGAAVIAVGLALAWLLSLALSRPVRRLARTAAQLGEGDLEARTEVQGKGELASLGRSFNRMADTISANIRAQRDFLANASHQLRTPLTGLRLRLEAIESEGGPAAVEASKAQAEVTRLAELVEDLLELARATSLENTGGRVDLSEAARSAVDRWAGPAAERGKRLVERIDGPCIVWASAQDVSHVLDNLIENSIRYAPEGAEITMETAMVDDRVRIAVADTGPGIPPEDRTRVFERFYRGSAGKQAGPGTGLGLAVVAELVERWGGEVHIADGSVREPGARFEATFPVLPTIP